MKKYIDQPVNDHEEVSVRVTNSYFELEYFDKKARESTFVYLLPRCDKSLWVVANWETVFDFVLHRSEQELGLIRERFPVLGELIHNGIRDKYGKGALIRLEDPDEGETKWFIAGVAGNLDLEKDDIWSAPQLHQALKRVHEACGQLSQEMASLSSDQPDDDWTEIKRGFLRGVGKVAAVTLLGVLGLPSWD